MTRLTNVAPKNRKQCTAQKVQSRVLEKKNVEKSKICEVCRFSLCLRCVALCFDESEKSRWCHYWPIIGFGICLPNFIRHIDAITAQKKFHRILMFPMYVIPGFSVPPSLRTYTLCSFPFHITSNYWIETTEPKNSWARIVVCTTHKHQAYSIRTINC